ncbi:hypothetical protein IG631_16513 [Alternaria alternata]|nr:hypothetical protein IG631_16513 [Alternaria alternata]
MTEGAAWKRTCGRLEHVGGAGGQHVVKTVKQCSAPHQYLALEGVTSLCKSGAKWRQRHAAAMEATRSLVPARAWVSAHTPEPILVFTSLHSAPTSAYSCSILPGQ